MPTMHQPPPGQRNTRPIPRIDPDSVVPPRPASVPEDIRPLFEVWCGKSSNPKVTDTTKPTVDRAVRLQYDVPNGTFTATRLIDGNMYVRVDLPDGRSDEVYMPTGTNTATLDVDKITANPYATAGFTHAYHADVGVTTASTLVTAWADQIGSINPVASVDSGITKPTLNATAHNSKPAIVFNGSSDALDIASPLFPTGTTSGQPWTVMAYVKVATGTSIYTQADSTALATGRVNCYWSSNFASAGMQDDANHYQEASKGGAASGTWIKITWRFDGTNITVRVDGVNGTPVAKSPLTGGLTTLYGCIGAMRSQSGHASYSGIQLQSLLASNTYVSDANVSAVESLLDTRWA